MAKCFSSQIKYHKKSADYDNVRETQGEILKYLLKYEKGCNIRFSIILQ